MSDSDSEPFSGKRWEGNTADEFAMLELEGQSDELTPEQRARNAEHARIMAAARAGQGAA
jgi:hypothetical protein